MARFTGTTGDDTFTGSFQRDSIVVEPGGGRDTVANFDPKLDIITLNGFTTLDSYADLQPFFNSDDGGVTLDVSAAEGQTAGTQTLTFSGIQGSIPEESVFFNIDPDPVFFDDDYVPEPPGGSRPINAEPLGVTIKNGPVDEAHSNGTQQDDVFYPQGGVDFITTYGGRDTIVVTPAIGTIYLQDFNNNRDTVIFNDFPGFDSFDDLQYPNVSYIRNGNEPPDQNFRPFYVIAPEGWPNGGPGNVVFNLEIIPEYFTPGNIRFNQSPGAIDPTLRRDVDLVGVTERVDVDDFTVLN